MFRIESRATPTLAASPNGRAAYVSLVRYCETKKHLNLRNDGEEEPEMEKVLRRRKRRIQVNAYRNPVTESPWTSQRDTERTQTDCKDISLWLVTACVGDVWPGKSAGIVVERLTDDEACHNLAIREERRKPKYLLRFQFLPQGAVERAKSLP